MPIDTAGTAKPRFLAVFMLDFGKTNSGTYGPLIQHALRKVNHD
jgi:hypothetical protein